MKTFVSCLLVLVLLLSCTFAFAEDATIHYEGSGFDTAQDAVTCYMNGLKNLDFEQMLSAYAWETLASHYSVEISTKRMRVYLPTVSARMPSFNDFMVSANLNMLRANEVRLIYSALEAYIMGEDYHDGKAITLKEESEVDAFLQKFDNGRLEQLSGMGEILFLTPDVVTDGKFSYEINQENFKKQTAQYGADEVVNVVALATVGQGILVCMPTVARYGDRWYMVSASSFTDMILGVAVNYQAFFYKEGSLADLFR